MTTRNDTRWFKGAFVFFAASAVLGLGFVVLGPVALIRLLGLVALLCAALGCALELWALRRFDPRAYAVVRARMRREPRTAWAARRPAVLHSVILQRRPAQVL